MVGVSDKTGCIDTVIKQVSEKQNY
jgi:hypothetical protein